jgi:hypothetical protein
VQILQYRIIRAQIEHDGHVGQLHGKPTGSPPSKILSRGRDPKRAKAGLSKVNGQANQIT